MLMKKTNEEYFNSVFNNTGTEMLVIDDNKEILMTNSMVEEMFGYSKDEIAGKSEAEIEHQYEFQNLLLKIFQDFSNVPGENIDDMINLTLRLLGEFDNDDRCYIFLFSDDESSMNNAYEWCREGIESKTENLKGISTGRFSWWMKKLKNHENIHIEYIDELPVEALAEKEVLKRENIKSIIAVPMSYENSLIGYLGFDSVGCEKIWKRESIYLLVMAAYIIEKALLRKKNIMELRESENYYRTIFENTGAATYILEEDTTISKVNREWENSFGYTREELEGKKWMDVFPESDRKLMEQYHNLRRIDPTKAPKRYTSHIKNKAGLIRDCLITVDIIPGTNKSIATHADITEYNRTNRVLKTTSAINMTMLHAENEQSLLKEVCRQIVEIGGYFFAWVAYIEKAGNKNIVPAAYAGNENGFLECLNKILKDNDRSKAAFENVFREKSFISNNIEKDSRCIFWSGEAAKRGYKSIISIPLDIRECGSRGALIIYSDREDAFDLEEVEFLREITENLSYGINSLRTRIERNRTANELEISLKRMQGLLFNTVAALASSLEIRDPYTAGHQKRVALLAGEIAREMKLPVDQIEGISVAGTIHDIGKSAIPSEILCKPGKISNIEFMLIKEHCQVGYDIIKKIEFPWPVAKVILQHHERMDGSGYPNGIKGDEIILGARIMAVADVVEAIASQRPYRAALGLGEALKEISHLKGKHFDPDVVDACLNLFEKGYVLAETEN